MREIEVAIYAHHHGQGHLRRACAIAKKLQPPVTIFSSLVGDSNIDGIAFRNLPLDYDEGTLPASFEHLHYAPLAVEGLRQRAQRLTAWFVDHWPCFLIVDVSVEIAALARLCGVPFAYVRQRGERFDKAHEFVYASATRLIAPFPEGWEEASTPSHWRDKTDYTGLISRYERNAQRKPTIFHESQRPRKVTVVTGLGGTVLTASALVEAAVACPHWHWTVIAPVQSISQPCPSNLTFLGTVADPLPWLENADVVVGSAGDSLVSEIAHLQKRFVCFPEDRPFNEQIATADLLRRLELAIVLTELPRALEWPALLQRGIVHDTARWTQWLTGGAKEAARVISRVATQALSVE